MTQKHLICPEKVRRVPKQFSWVDHRLVRDHLIEQCSHQALALYLFLITVADQQGLSYYSDRSISARLAMDLIVLQQSRNELIGAKLVACRKPLYQVLSLEPLQPVRPQMEKPLSNELRKRVLPAATRLSKITSPGYDPENHPPF